MVGSEDGRASARVHHLTSGTGSPTPINTFLPLPRPPLVPLSHLAHLGQSRSDAADRHGAISVEDAKRRGSDAGLRRSERVCTAARAALRGLGPPFAQRLDLAAAGVGGWSDGGWGGGGGLVRLFLGAAQSARPPPRPKAPGRTGGRRAPRRSRPRLGPGGAEPRRPRSRPWPHERRQCACPFRRAVAPTARSVPSSKAPAPADRRARGLSRVPRRSALGALFIFLSLSGREASLRSAPLYARARQRTGTDPRRLGMVVAARR